MSSAAHVLVTGGTGFVGSAVVGELLARGASVAVLLRPSSATAALPEGVARQTGDLGDPRGLKAAFEGAARAAARANAPLDLVHCAAHLGYRAAEALAMARANVEGTRHVLAAARAVGIRRMCHVSSVAALGVVAGPGFTLDDEAPLGGLALDSAYARTKAEAERAVVESGLEVVVASPGVVFGFSERASNSRHFLERVVNGTLGPLAPPGSISVVGLADTARGIVAALERGATGRRYLLVESAWRLFDLLRLVAGLVGRAGPLATVPAPIWRLLTGCVALADPVLRTQRATPEALRLAGLHFRFQGRRARAELGWQPESIERVLARTVEAIRAPARGGPA